MQSQSKCFLPSFKSISLLVQEKKRKIDFQDVDGHANITDFYIILSLCFFMRTVNILSDYSYMRI